MPHPTLHCIYTEILLGEGVVRSLKQIALQISLRRLLFLEQRVEKPMPRGVVENNEDLGGNQLVVVPLGG